MTTQDMHGDDRSLNNNSHPADLGNTRQKLKVKRVRAAFFIGLFAILSGAAILPARALSPTNPPGGNFDLSHWYVQLPTSNGILTGGAGSVDSASASQLAGGFTNTYFYTGADGSMTFWAPDDGATTSGSTHPRSELRELLNPNDNSLNWYVFGTNILTAQCKVTQVPSDTQKVCVGQIHEPNNKPDGSVSAGNEEMIMFDLASKTIYANINLDGNTNNSFSTTFVSGSSVQTNALINYSFSVVNGLFKLVINNVTNSWNLLSGTNYQGHVATNWSVASGNTLYFKAGDYNQTDNACGCSNDGARVAFYAVSLYHSASITNQPTNCVGKMGGSAAFSVGAIGNTNLNYQWLFNGAALANATNASLSLSNLAATNVGGYSVVVTDPTPGFSAVTSSVASLGLVLPAVITNATLAANHRSFAIKGTGTPSQPYALMTTTNLATPVLWTPLATNTATTNGAISFTDFQVTNYNRRYYCVVIP